MKKKKKEAKVIEHFLPYKFGQAIIAKRTKDGTSLRDLEKQTGLHKTTVYRAELAESLPDIDTYFKICQWLEVPLDKFFVKGKNK
jgi:transcriptional regulator with XRE-family HTH domain